MSISRANPIAWEVNERLDDQQKGQPTWLRGCEPGG